MAAMAMNDESDKEDDYDVIGGDADDVDVQISDIDEPEVQTRNAPTSEKTGLQRFRGSNGR